MLPTNAQSLNAADRAVLENLKQQGEQIDRQTKVLETLVDKVTRQMRSDDRLEKSGKKDKNKLEGDTKVNDIPGVLFDKFSDKLNDFISYSSNAIKDKFKDEKSKPAEKQETAKKEKEQTDDLDVLKSILENMVSSSKYQEQMLEHTKTMQAIADKTFVSINDLKDNLQNIEQPEIANTTEKINESNPDKKENTANKIKSNKEKQIPALFKSKEASETTTEGIGLTGEKIPDSIGVSVGKNLKPQFDVLGKTLKDALSDGFYNLQTAIESLNLNKLPIPVPPVPPGPPVAPVAAATAASPLLAAGALGTVAVGGAALTYGAANYLSKLDNDSLETLSNSGGGDDTAMAAAIQLQGNKGEERKAERIQNPTQSQIRELDNAIAKKEKPDKLGFGPGMKAPVTAEDYKKIAAQKLQKNTLENVETQDAASKASNALNPTNNITPKKTDKTSLMKEVTDEKTSLASDANKSSAPIIVNNTNNNVSGESSSANYASATPRNQSTAVNDYLRGNGRLMDSVR
jgi:hypothetical protein